MDMGKTNDALMQMGLRLKQTRTALGMTQSEFGEILGIEPNSLSSWESGLRTINPLALIRVCNKYRIPTDWIYLGDMSGLPHGLAQEILGRISLHSESQSDPADDIEKAG